MEDFNSNICWDVHFVCMNDNVITAHACQEVAKQSTISYNFYKYDVKNLENCDSIKIGKIDDIKSVTTEKSVIQSFIDLIKKSIPNF